MRCLQRPAVGHELVAEHVAQPLLGAGRAPLRQQLAVLPDREADVRPRQRMAAHGFQAMCGLGGVGLQELAPRRRAEEQLAHLDAGARRARGRRQLAAARVQPGGMRRVGGAAGDATARTPRPLRPAPRRGSPSSLPAPGRAAKRSCWWHGASAPAAVRAAGMPMPSSSTTMLRTPPATRRTLICVAPASSALSTSSRTTEAGRSTTSPAAIWLTSSSGSSRMARRGAASTRALIAAL